MADMMERTVSITAGEDGLRLVVGGAELRLTPEMAAEVCGVWLAYRQGIDHDAEPVCDNCGEAVEPDAEGKYWVHRGGTRGWTADHYVCGDHDAASRSLSGIAEVDGSGYAR